MDEDVKLVERPLALEIVPVEAIKFRLVMEIMSSSLDPVLEQAYTFDEAANNRTGKSDIFGGNAVHQSLKITGTRKTHHQDLATENCKLESIIEQYNESNALLKTQLAEIKTATSKSEAMLCSFQSFFEELKTKQYSTLSKDSTTDTQVTREVFPDVKLVVDKICDAIHNKEEHYMRESLREFSDLLAQSRSKIKDLEAYNSELEVELVNTKRNFELLEFELKDVMSTVQGICDPDIQNQPVNFYQLKSELRTKLKLIANQKLEEAGSVIEKPIPGANKENEPPLVNRPTFAQAHASSKIQANIDQSSDEKGDYANETQHAHFYGSREKLPKRSLLNQLELCPSKESKCQSVGQDCMSDMKPQAHAHFVTPNPRPRNELKGSRQPGRLRCLWRRTTSLRVGRCTRGRSLR